MSNDRVTFTLNHVVNELNRKADRILRTQFGLTYSQFLFLLHVRALGPVTASGLARSMGVSRAAVSKRIPWFGSRGLVSLGGDRSDSRVVTLEATKTGADLVTQMSDALEGEFRARFRDLEHVDLDRLNDTLLELLAHMQSSAAERTLIA